MTNETPKWWQTGVIYQIYPRSFKDSNHDGIGDLAGIIEKLDYLSELGVSAIWISPFYPSPMKDFGYDVADYCNVDPMFGDLQVFDRLIAQAHARHIKVIIDWVPNHTSDQHPWFLESRSSRDNAKRNWYIWKDPQADGGKPNNWGSIFGWSGWEWDEATQQYYFHQFVKEQPDLNWRNNEVKTAMMDVLHFWMQRGVDGFRMDVVNMIMKHPDMPDQPYHEGMENGDELGLYFRQAHPYDQDYDGIHPLMREFRRLVDEYGDTVIVGEIWMDVDRWKLYYGSEDKPEIHLPFNFRLIEVLEWTATNVREQIRVMEKNVPWYGFPNYVLNNHDRSRFSSRVSVNQARNAAMLLLTLRGTPTLYNGEELGMIDGVIQDEQVRDPQGLNMGTAYTRDVCRTPMQWDDSDYAGFSTVDTWLPVNADFKTVNVATQSQDKHSMLNLYKRLIQLRNEHPALSIGEYTELDSPKDVLLYERLYGDAVFVVALNFSDKPISFKLPYRGNIVLDTGLKRSGEPVPHDLELWGHEGVVVRVKN